ncbi:MAG: hypothetical protein HY290_04290 [Planctomycetia bacterium]|nr:hypothetical protein [Planctomycetia bacterium]
MKMPRIIGKFALGRVVITPGAMSKVSPEELFTCLLRHGSGDWGDLDEQDWRQNEAALEHGGRLFSRYRTRQGTKLYVITEHDRSITTILLPEEY